MYLPFICSFKIPVSIRTYVVFMQINLIVAYVYSMKVSYESILFTSHEHYRHKIEVPIFLGAILLSMSIV